MIKIITTCFFLMISFVVSVPIQAISNAPLEQKAKQEQKGKSHGNKYELSPKQFDKIYARVKSKSFDKDKMEILDVSLNNSYISCRQCAQLLKLITFNSNKMPALQILAPYVYDEQNRRVILDLFPFRSDKEMAERLLLKANARPPHYNNEPNHFGDRPLANRQNTLNDKDFNKLYNRVKLANFGTEKMQLISQAVYSYYITNAQCACLLRTFNFVSDQLEALKVLSNGLTDRNNVEVILDVFDSRSEREKASRILR